MNTGDLTMGHEEHRDYTGSKMGMWLFLLTELFLFGGLFFLYAVYRYKYPADFQHGSTGLNLRIGTVNSLILVTSSLAMTLSIAAIRKGKKALSAYFLALTILLGSVFIVNKYSEWASEISHGIYPGSEGLLRLEKGEIAFYGLYYVMTGMHGAHVIAGVVLLGAVFFFVIREKVNKDDFVVLENSGLYWHLVDIIWIYLFPLFYLIA